jgi:lipopolysaccharide/colanic/teichoic acid biosynthesis glycosyltransferase
MDDGRRAVVHHPSSTASPREPAAKRLVDILVAGLGLTSLAPVLGTIAAAVRLDSPGPALYRARRVGRGGVEFTMYKFRTMHVNRPAHGPRITHQSDPRVTRVGRLLRRTKIDELPQLWNVLIGDMSLVGPRPEDPHYVALYTPEQRRVLEARPGITSLASARFRDEERLLVGADWERTYVTQVMAAKLAIDLDYVERRSLALDARVLWETAKSLIRH